MTPSTREEYEEIAAEAPPPISSKPHKGDHHKHGKHHRRQPKGPMGRFFRSVEDWWEGKGVLTPEEIAAQKEESRNGGGRSRRRNMAGGGGALPGSYATMQAAWATAPGAARAAKVAKEAEDAAATIRT